MGTPEPTVTIPLEQPKVETTAPAQSETTEVATPGSEN